MEPERNDRLGTVRISPTLETFSKKISLMPALKCVAAKEATRKIGYTDVKACQLEVIAGLVSG